MQNVTFFLQKNRGIKIRCTLPFYWQPSNSNSLSSVVEFPSLQRIFSVIDDNSNTYPDNRFRLGLSFTANDSYTGINFNGQYDVDHRSVFLMDDVELVEDNFSAGDDLFSAICNQVWTLGGDSFCMLSDVEIKYDWYKVDENGEIIEPPLLTYTELNGTLSGPNTFDVAPGTTTTYRLVRTIQSTSGPTTLLDFCETLPDGSEVCHDSDDIVVFVANGAPNAIFTATEGNCGVYQLTADPSTENMTHSWSLVMNGMPPQLFSNLYQPNELILGNGDFTIIHNVTNVCGTSTFEIEVLDVDCDNCPTPMAGFTYVQDCSAGTVTLTASSLEGTHSWDTDGDGIDDFSGPIVILPIADPTVPFTATVTHIVIEDICGESNAITVVIDDLEACEESFACPCEGENAVNIDAGAGTSIFETALAPLITATGAGNILNTNDRCIAIQGRLLIPDESLAGGFVDLSFFPGEVRMQPGAEIVIQENATVQFRTSGPTGNPAILNGCDELWQSITIEEKGQLSVSGLQIEDAQYAIHPLGGSVLDLNGNVFQENFIGIYHDDYYFTLLGCRGNTFDGSGALLPPFSAAPVGPVTVQTEPYAGMYLQFGSTFAPLASIGSAGDPNVFSNLRTGIYAGGTIDLMLTNNRFEGIQLSNTVAYPFEGQALVVDGEVGASLQLDGTVNGFALAFENCRRGIRTINTDTEIHHTGMQCNAVGIQVEDSKSQVHIHNNNLALPGGGIGINLLQNNAATDLLIEWNDITIETPIGGPFPVTGGKGIAIEEANARPQEFLAEVSYNTINVNTGVNGGGIFGDDPRYRGAGIFLNSVNNMDVEYNRDIYCNSTDDIGILVQNGEDLLFLDNHVFGQSGSIGTGILAEATQDVTYSCNAVLYLKHGMEFGAGSAMGSTIVQNNFQAPMTNGLVYRNMLDNMGAQPHRENEWSGTQGNYLGSAALNEGSNFLSIQNQFFTVTNSFLPPSVLLSNFPGQEGLWFFVDNQNPNPLPPCSLEGLPLSGDEGVYNKIADGTAISGMYMLPRQWMSQRALYKTLINETGSAPLSSELQSFLANASAGLLGGYHEVANEYPTTLEFDDLSTWRNNWQNKRTKLGELATMRDELLGESPSAYSWEDHDNLQSSLAILTTDLQTQWQNNEATKNQERSAILSQNATLAIELTAQQNEKDLSDILLTTVLADNLNWTSTQQQTLLTIGNQCPLEGGEVVYTARSVYQLIDPTYEFSNNCVGSTLLQGQEASGNVFQESLQNFKRNDVAHRSEFSIYPNPATDELILNYTKATRLEVFDAIGVLVKKVQLDKDSRQCALDVSKLAPGIYYLSLKLEDGSSQTEKVVITH